MVAARQTSFDDARKAKYPAAAWFIYVYVRIGELEAVQQCIEAFRSILGMSDEELGPERARLEKKLAEHLAAKEHERARRAAAIAANKKSATSEQLVDQMMGG